MGAAATTISLAGNRAACTGSTGSELGAISSDNISLRQARCEHMKSLIIHGLNIGNIAGVAVWQGDATSTPTSPNPVQPTQPVEPAQFETSKLLYELMASNSGFMLIHSQLFSEDDPTVTRIDLSETDDTDTATLADYITHLTHQTHQPNEEQGQTGESSTNANGTIMVSAECIGIETLSFINAGILPFIGGMNLSNNQLSEQVLLAVDTTATLLNMPRLKYLHIGGNPIRNALTVTLRCGFLLQVLDMSYTEQLKFDSRCFQFCPLLIKLALDGCNIKTTTSMGKRGLQGADDGESIFYGLLALQELSMKENELESTESLSGLNYFSLKSLATLGATGTSNATPVPPPSATLHHLYLADNPICDNTPELRKFRSSLQAGISSLSAIDTFVIPASTSSSSSSAPIHLPSILKRKEGGDPDMTGTGGGGGLDSMEQEFLSALKGERDNSVVS
jgi:hypothetical protein